MKWIINIFVLFSGLLYSSCIGCSSSSKGEYDATTNYSEYDDEHEQDISSNQQQDDFQLTGIIETCRLCKGYGWLEPGFGDRGNGTLNERTKCDVCQGNKQRACPASNVEMKKYVYD